MNGVILSFLWMKFLRAYKLGLLLLVASMSQGFTNATVASVLFFKNTMELGSEMRIGKVKCHKAQCSYQDSEAFLEEILLKLLQVFNFHAFKKGNFVKCHLFLFCFYGGMDFQRSLPPQKRHISKI